MSGWWRGLAGCLVVIAAIGVSADAVSQQSPFVASLPDASSQRALLDQYRVPCHNARARAGNLVLEGVDLVNLGPNAQTWEKVSEKLRMGAMPPPGRPRPDGQASQALVSYLETSLDRVAASNPDPGRTEVFHRLTRTEYQRAIRDLLTIDIDVAELLPADAPDQHGFDNAAGCAVRVAGPHGAVLVGRPQGRAAWPSDFRRARS